MPVRPPETAVRHQPKSLYGFTVLAIRLPPKRLFVFARVTQCKTLPHNPCVPAALLAADSAASIRTFWTKLVVNRQMIGPLRRAASPILSSQRLRPWLIFNY
jgi:hypothetical protein